MPTRTPVPAEAELVALTRDTASLAALAATVPGAVAADLATIHRRQHSVLRTTLLAARCRPTPSTPRTDRLAPRPPAPPARPRPRRAAAAPRRGASALAAAEGASAAAAGTFAGVAPDLRATIASLHAQRYAAATLLAGRPPTVPLDPVGGDHVEALADLDLGGRSTSSRSSAARSTGQQRARPTRPSPPCAPCAPTSWPAVPRPTTRSATPCPSRSTTRRRRPAGPQRRSPACAPRYGSTSARWSPPTAAAGSPP